MTHPGETDPGYNCQRLMCPLCDWYHDEPNTPPNLMVDWPQGARTLDEAVNMVVRQRHDRIEAVVVDHMTSAHTAPIVLNR